MNKRLLAAVSVLAVPFLFLALPPSAQPQNSSASTHASPPQKSSPCLSYEPAVVELTGTIIQRTFPGPPNYESVAKGDAPEVYWLLALSHPVCVDADKADPDASPAQKDIREIQLVFMDPSAYKTYKTLLGKKAVAKGTLFAASTGHHKTPVLLTVNSLAKP